MKKPGEIGSGVYVRNIGEKKLIGLLTASHGLVHLFEGVLPPLIPLLMVEFGTDYFHLGMVVFVFSYAFGLGSLPAGHVADKLGPHRLVSLYLFGSGILSICVWPANTLFTYGLVMGLMGVFCSTYHPASNTLISHTIREKGKGFGIHGIAGSLGVALVPLASAWFGSALGWKAPHIVFGLCGVLVGVYSLTVPRVPVISDRAFECRKTRKGLSRAQMVNVFVFYLSVALIGLTYKGIMTFLPVYMGENVHLSFVNLNTVTLGGTIATIALLAGAFGQYVAGRFLDVYKTEALYLAALAIGTIFVFVMAKGSNLVLVIAAVIYAFFYFATQPIQNFLISDYLPKHRHGIGYGLNCFLIFGVGSIGAAVSGYLADHWGLQAVFYAMGLCFLVSSCVAGFLLIWSLVQGLK
jgi:MFS family permease